MGGNTRGILTTLLGRCGEMSNHVVRSEQRGLREA